MRRLVWLAVPVAVACSSGENETTATTTGDVFQACMDACAKQTACVPPAPLIDCNTVCASATTPDASAGCDLTAQKGRYDQCGRLMCVNIGSCVVDVSVSCQGGGGGPGTGGAPAGGTGGATSSGGIAGATGGTAGGTGGTAGSSGADCVACDSHANTCCRALATRIGQDPAQCDDVTEAKCRAAPATEQSAFADQCRTQVQTGASLGIAACQ